MESLFIQPSEYVLISIKKKYTYDWFGLVWSQMSELTTCLYVLNLLYFNPKCVKKKKE